MALYTAPQLQAILDQAAAESGGSFTPFDSVFYANAHSGSVNAWLAANPGKGLLDHFVQLGSAQGLATADYFDPQFYLNQWPDLQVFGLDGTALLAHYTVNGIAEGRAGVASMLEFDGARYLTQYPDVAAYVNANLDDFRGSASNGAGAHFIKFGAKEGREAYTLSGQPLEFDISFVPATAPITFVDGVLNLDTNFGDTTLTAAAAPVDGATVDGVMRLTGDADIRIDFTNKSNQIRGVDLNGNGGIEVNGVENNVGNAGVLKASNFTIVDAYARNPISALDTKNNFQGDIRFDGTGYFGDGRMTNGNIFLGGQGVDTAFGGIGNDFMAGGGAVNVWGGTGTDWLDGGRNADFFFREVSALDPDDDPSLWGGETEDVDPPQGQSSSLEDFDWYLFEASDDNEPQYINLGYQGIENLNASGNLYGFLDDLAVNLGQRAVEVLDGRLPTATGDGSENYGVGTTAQLDVYDNYNDDNVVIAGFDNDNVYGNDGRDVIAGGDLRYLITNLNNPNLVQNGGLHLNVRGGLVTDGVDNLQGGGDDDAIMFEMDGGTIGGGGDNGTSREEAANTGDILYFTDFSTGRVDGAKLADEAGAQAAALAVATRDSTIRVDLMNDDNNANGASYRGYGGSEVGGQDQTNYATGLKAVQVNNMQSVITTGLGRMDYDADGGNSSELFHAQQNFAGLDANVHLRGDYADNALYANTGTDVVEGREGDDLLSGGKSDDTLTFQFGDGVDIVHRQKDANGDGLWDGYNWVKDSGGQFTQDFRAPQQGNIDASQLSIDFDGTDLADPGVAVTQFVVTVGSTALIGGTTAVLSAATTLAQLATIVNTAFQAADPDVSVTVAGTALIVTDAQGRVIGDTVATGTVIAGTAVSGTLTTTIVYTPSGGIVDVVEDDILVFRDYANRSINLGTDATKNQIDNAADLVVNFTANADGTPNTRLANEQAHTVEFGGSGDPTLDQVREGDIVSVIVNGKEIKYTLKAGEDAFDATNNLATAINGELDKNSAAATLSASTGDNNGNGYYDLTVTNANGTYMAFAAKVIDGKSGADVTAQRAEVSNESSTHINLFQFKGTDGGLNGHDVLFVGKTDTSVSLLQTAKDAGETITGTAATEDADSAGVFINGNDQLIGGRGNDTLNGLSGADLFIMSAGTDAVDGGAGGGLLSKAGTYAFNDLLRGEQGTFDPSYTDAGFRFTTTLDADYTKGGKGTLVATSGTGTVLGTTTFTDTETVRMLSNNRQDSLDLKAVSDKIAVDSAPDLLEDEGVVVDLTAAAGPNFARVDVNNNNVIAASEIFTLTAVLGTENVTTGNANDTVNVDHTQAGANNIFNLGSQTHHNNPLILTEGRDQVNYNHTALKTADIPSGTLKVESSANTDTYELTKGALGTTKTTDTLIDVERVAVQNAARNLGDVLDVSGVGGAAVMFSFATGNSVTTRSTTGGELTPADTVAKVEANTLETGGVSKLGATLGNELIEIDGITQFEKVLGGAADDVVALSDAFTQTNSKGGGATEIGRATVLGKSTTLAVNNGLFTFDLAAGTNDTLDYFFGSGDAVYVSVDTSGAGKHLGLFSDAQDFNLNDGNAQDRVDATLGVERFYGVDDAPSQNIIDLVGATVDTTIEFSQESKSNGNEFKDWKGDASPATTDQVRGIRVNSTADGAVFARFMDRTAANVNGDSFWGAVFGSAKAETVVVTDNETDVAHQFNLAAGANVVDYSARTAPVTAAIQPVNTVPTPDTQQVLIDGDTITVASANYALGEKTLTVVASDENGDVLDISALTTKIDSFNLVDLNSGIVVEDFFNAVAAEGQGNVIFVNGFEDILGSASRDRLYGDGSSNDINGGANADWLVGRGGRGTLGGGPAGDTLTGGAGGDRFVYETELDSATNYTGAFTDEGQDEIVDFALDDLLVFNTTDGAAVKLGAAATVVVPGATVQVQIDQNGDGDVTDAADDDYTIVDTAGTIVDTNVLLRVGQSSGQDLQYLDNLTGAVDGQFELVYTQATQSNNLALPDEFHNLELNTAGGLGNGADRFDLRSFDFGQIATGDSTNGNAGADDSDRNDNGVADRVESIIYGEPTTVNSIVAVANFFRDGAAATGTMRAVHVQKEGVTGDFRVFVDVNRDGNYVQADDLVFDLRDPLDGGVAVVPPTDALTFYNDPDADGLDATDEGIFIMTDGQYIGFWS